MKVLKFGSSAVANAQRIKDVANLVSSKRGEGNIIVLSAIEGTNDTLAEIADYLYKKNADGANELINELERRYLNLAKELFAFDSRLASVNLELKDRFAKMRSMSKEIFTLFEEKKIVAQGPTLLSFLFAEYLSTQGVKAPLVPAFDFMKIDKNEEPDTQFIRKSLTAALEQAGEADLYITEGFICKNAYGETDNLKRGGSDYTASLIGAAVGAEEIQIWSDQNGIYNNDNRIVKNAKTVEKLNFEEAAELSYFGEKTLHPTSILPAKLANIPVRLLNALEPDAQGTLISTDYAENKIEAIAAKDGISAIRIKSGKMLLAHGFLRKVFEIFERFKTPIDMITTSEVGVSITIDNSKNLDDIIDELKMFGTVSADRNMTIVCVVGDLADKNVGFQSKITSALKDITIRMISYGGSSHNMSFLIHTEDKEKALNALNDSLFS